RVLRLLRLPLIRALLRVGLRLVRPRSPRRGKPDRPVGLPEFAGSTTQSRQGARTMRALHWTGAALLLAVAIRHDRPTRPQRDPTLLEWGGLRPSASPGGCP